MPKQNDLFSIRKSLDEICTVPDKIISVYSLEKHVWANANSLSARKSRKPELQTLKEFQLDPVRPFLMDILRKMAAPYKPERKDSPVGQGYWIQAEFGSGKSHLLCALATLALGNKNAWKIIQEKESKAGRGKRETLYRFWEEGIKAKSSKGKKGIFVVVKTLVGSGGGTVGVSDKGKRLSEYILDAAKEQLQIELGKNVSLYPPEILADRFISQDLERYRKDLKKFLRDPKYFEEDEFEDLEDFIRDIQQDKTPEYKRSCGNKLWRFYDESLGMQPHIVAETEDVLKNMTETILAEGYSGILLVLDEVSLFMKNRDEDQRTDDEKTLVVLSNRVANVHNLPIWTVCSAQQAIESKMGVKNIIADDRLKIVKLLEEDKDYYDIVLARVREIKDSKAIGSYYLHYKKGFTWPNSIGDSEFRHFFPFHRPALEVLRDITYELTTTRSAIHFMHQTLKQHIKNQANELIRLWELFDETVRYEEDPSGVHAGLVAIKTKKESDYRAYEACKRQIDSSTKGILKVHRDKAIKVIQTLFLYHIAKTRQQGITPEEIANSVLIERSDDSNPDENIQHFETIAEELKKQLRQIVHTYDDDGNPRYRFDPVFTGVDPRDEFQKARDEAESNELMQKEAWDHLLALDEWPVKTRHMTIDISSGVKSMFRDIAPFVAPWEDLSSKRTKAMNLEINWNGRQIFGLVSMRDLGKMISENIPIPPINTDETDHDFSVFTGTRPISKDTLKKLVLQRKDPRILFWTSDQLKQEERDRLLDFAAYRKLIADWQGKDSEDAVAVISWVAESLKTEMGKIQKIVDNSFARGRFDALNNTQMEFHVAGELTSILSPLIDRVLTAVYESRDIKFDTPFYFRKEEVVKVINGIVKAGHIPKGAKPNQNISAAQNFGIGLKLVKKGAEKELDVSGNLHIQEMWSFIEDKLTDDGQTMKIETLYKNFMGVGGPKDFGLTRRMVQLYILSLVKDGKIRIGVGPKSGLPSPWIDYSNITDVDFAAKTLDSLTEIQKMGKPENWEVLRPYAEKILDEEIASTHDDAVISEYRAKIRSLFEKEKTESLRLQNSAKSLFEAIKSMNPYETELDQVRRFFFTDLESGNDIDLLLYGLKDIFGYLAFDTGSVSQTEVDDLANRLRNYRDLQNLLTYENDLITANLYCNHHVPKQTNLKEMLKTRQKVCKKLDGLQTFIDSDIKLKTELIGKTPPAKGETGTIGRLIYEYLGVYAALHDLVLSQTESYRKEIQSIIEGTDLKALHVLEKISVLQPAVNEVVENDLNLLMDGIFRCSDASRRSVEEQIKRGPVHMCGLTFVNAHDLVNSAKVAAEQASLIFNSTFNDKLEIFLNPTVRKRLKQGESEETIQGLLKCNSVKETRSYLVKVCIEDPSIVDLINKYLKKIVVKKIDLSEFKPSLKAFEKSQLNVIIEDFENYLKDQWENFEENEDTLPMLKID